MQMRTAAGAGTTCSYQCCGLGRSLWLRARARRSQVALSLVNKEPFYHSPASRYITTAHNTIVADPSFNSTDGIFFSM